MSDVPPVIAQPAATVVLLREGTDGYEVLLVRRNAQLSFHGGAWVFPGGRIDAEDHVAAGTSADPLAAARYAAVREAFEEASMVVAPEELVALSRWVTPEAAPKRFDAWFFLGRAGNDLVQVDGGEIHEHRWMRPADALAAQRVGEIDLPPPTWVTLRQLVAYRTAAEVLAAAARGPVEIFEPRLQFTVDGACSLYAGDVAYHTGDMAQPGPRHRLWMVDSGWRYERTNR